MAFVRCPGTRFCFQKRYSTNQTHEKLLATLVSKYHLGSDSILLSWILKHPAQVIPIAGTNVARIQSLMKAVELELDKEDWFAIWTESMGNDVA
jgi:predicted oxidoreductase